MRDQGLSNIDILKVIGNDESLNTNFPKTLEMSPESWNEQTDTIFNKLGNGRLTTTSDSDAEVSPETSSLKKSPKVSKHVLPEEMKKQSHTEKDIKKTVKNKPFTKNNQFKFKKPQHTKSGVKKYK